MIEFATQRNFDRHEMYLITMWFVIVNEGVQGSIALHCNVQTLNHKDIKHDQTFSHELFEAIFAKKPWE
jgi:hypothetical protein